MTHNLFLFSLSISAAYPTIIRLKNDTVSLPCNISQTKEEENSIKLILWYKNNILGTPIYSIDARDTNISQARHFVAPPYQGRATFELNLSARLALLVVRPLAAEDEGHYICRVDFRWTRTTVSTVKLDVIGKHSATRPTTTYSGDHHFPSLHLVTSQKPRLLAC